MKSVGLCILAAALIAGGCSGDTAPGAADPGPVDACPDPPAECTSGAAWICDGLSSGIGSDGVGGVIPAPSPCLGPKGHSSSWYLAQGVWRAIPFGTIS